MYTLDDKRAGLQFTIEAWRPAVGKSYKQMLADRSKVSNERERASDVICLECNQGVFAGSFWIHGRCRSVFFNALHVSYFVTRIPTVTQ